MGVEYVYDPKTDKWVPKTTPEPATPNDNSTGKDTKTQVDSKTKAEKEFIETEFNTLTGDVSVSPSTKSIRLRVNDTVEIQGIGSYLSGTYFVSSIKRTINKDSGYSQSLSVLKNGFGGSLKKSGTETRVQEVEKSAPALKVGDTVRIVGDNAVYSNAHDGVKVPAWVKKKDLTVRQISSDGNRALLMPIFSWTYVRFIQKV